MQVYIPVELKRDIGYLTGYTGQVFRMPDLSQVRHNESGAWLPVEFVRDEEEFKLVKLPFTLGRNIDRLKVREVHQIEFDPPPPVQEPSAQKPKRRRQLTEGVGTVGE